jgi:hypothetical protein
MGRMSETIPAYGPLKTDVYPSISYDEFGRLLRKYGHPAEAILDRNRFGYRTLTEPRFGAWMQTPFRRRPDEFASVFLFSQADLAPADAATIMRGINWKMMVAHVSTNGRGRLFAAHTLVVCGGITEYYLRDQLWYWTKDLELIRAEVRKQTRRAAGSTLH